MKTPNFTTRVPTEMLDRFRKAADLWAKRQRERGGQYLAGGESRNLTRWMLTRLQEAAREEMGEGREGTGEDRDKRLDRGLNSSL